MVCALAALTGGALADETVADRIASRSFPSVYEAWGDAENLAGAAGPASKIAEAAAAQRDLVFVTFNALGLRPATPRTALSVSFNPKSVETARARRARIQALNPHFIALASISYRNVRGDWLPEDSPFWLRDAAGERVHTGSAMRGNQFFLDYRKPETQAAIAAHCKALIATGVFDGCMFDWWNENLADDPIDPNGEFRTQLIAKVRAAVGESAILVGNTNQNRPTKSGRYLNGLFMEGFGAPYFLSWRTAAADFAWAATHLHKPTFTLLEGRPTAAQPRGDLARIREVTTLSLTMSNGYVLYADRNPGNIDLTQDWYPFWSARLGRPKEPPRHPNGATAVRREFEHGSAVFNPPEGAPAEVKFKEERISAASGKRARAFTVAPRDGDMFLRP